MNARIWVVLGCVALAGPGAAGSRAQNGVAQTTSKPPVPAAPLQVKIGEWITNGPVRLRAVRVMDPYYDPYDYGNDPPKDGSGRILPARYAALMLELQNLSSQEIKVRFNSCRFVDEKGAGTPLTGEIDTNGITLSAGTHSFETLKFNPLMAFGKPTELVSQIRVYLHYFPSDKPEERKAQQEKSEQFRRAYAPSERLFQITLNPSPAKAVRKPITAATKKRK